MTRERQLGGGRKNPNARCAVLRVARQNEGGLRKIELARDALHRRRVHTRRVGKDGERVRLQRRRGKDVDHVIREIHQPPPASTESAFKRIRAWLPPPWGASTTNRPACIEMMKSPRPVSLKRSGGRFVLTR